MIRIAEDQITFALKSYNILLSASPNLSHGVFEKMKNFEYLALHLKQHLKLMCGIGNWATFSLIKMGIPTTTTTIKPFGPGLFIEICLNNLQIFILGSLCEMAGYTNMINKQYFDKYFSPCGTSASWVMS